MVQSEIVQVDVAFLTFNPKRCADTPSVKQDNSCVAGVSELQKHRDYKRREKNSMGAEAYHHYKWYNSMLMHELKAFSESAKLKIIHWHIESGNVEAFMMGGVLYKAVSIVIGADMEHWYCANTGKDGTHSYGSRYRKQQKHQQHELNTKKIACFTIDDDEATLVIKPSTEGLTRCTIDICANNCIECKKFRSPFTKTSSKSRCVCYPDRDDFRSINDSDLENETESDEDIAQLPHQFFNRKGKFHRRFKLNAIHEESI